MLQSDEKILEILLNSKKNGNPLLQYFKISYPNKTIAQTSNTIFVACVSYEEKGKGFEHIEGKDLVEIVIVTKKVDNKQIKQTDYSDTKFIIKTVMKEIRRLLLSTENRSVFGAKPIFRNISPEYNSNYTLNRAHMLVEVPTLEGYDNSVDDINTVKYLLTDVETIVTDDDSYLHNKE